MTRILLAFGEYLLNDCGAGVQGIDWNQSFENNLRRGHEHEHVLQQLSHVILEAENSHDLLSASWRTRNQMA